MTTLGSNLENTLDDVKEDVTFSYHNIVWLNISTCYRHHYACSTTVNSIING